MIHPEQAKQAILMATASLAAGFKAMKKQADILPQAPLHREGVQRGIDLCLEVIEEFENNVGEAVDQVVPPQLSFWLLTLPVVTRPDDEGVSAWKNPDNWSGDWLSWRNRDSIITAAADEAEARRLAAEDDCGIWLDPAYASCEPLSATEAGVIVSTGGGAENE